MKPTISVSRISNFKSLGSLLKKSGNRSVYVGIKDPGNAQKLFIFSKGSPVQNIPARPVIEAAIEAEGNKERISLEIVKAQLAPTDDQSLRHLKAAGKIAAQASKDWFTDPRNNWAPNAISTIRHKKSSQPGIDSGEMQSKITSEVRNDS